MMSRIECRRETFAARLSVMFLTLADASNNINVPRNVPKMTTGNPAFSFPLRLGASV